MCVLYSRWTLRDRKTGAKGRSLCYCRVDACVCVSSSRKRRKKPEWNRTKISLCFLPPTAGGLSWVRR